MSVQLRDDQNRPSAGGVKSLPEGWLIKPLGEVATKIIGGGTPSREKPDYWKGNIPWLTVKDMRTTRPADAIDHISKNAVAESSTSIIPADTVIIATRVGLGKVIRVPYEAAINQDLKALIVPSTIEKAFLEYWFLSIASYLESIGSGTTVKGIRLEQLKAIEMPVPPPKEQRRIVAEIEKQFTRLEAGVAALRRVQANLKRYRAAVLKAACEGRLVPTEVELHRQLKTKNSKLETGAQLLTRILTERRLNWQGRGQYKEPAAPDTEKLPAIPVGWTWLTVEAIGFVTKLAGFEYTKYVKYSPDGDLAVIKAENAGRSGFKRTEISRIKSSTVAQLTRSQLKAGDLLMVFVGAGTGNVARVPDDQPYFLGPNIAMIRVDPQFVSEAYLEMFLRSPVGHSLTFGFIKAVAQPSLSMGTIRMIPVALPPLAEQTRIVAEVERRLSVVEELESVVSANLQRATRLRQSILHKAFSGELVATMPAIQISDIIPPLKPEHVQQPNSHFARALLSAEIVHRLHIEPTFGRIKHQKIFHLCEHIAQIEEIHGQYHREAAGPLDNKLIYANEAELKKQKWYQEVRRESYGHAYQALDKAGGHRKYVERYWADKLPTIEKLIELMRKWDTERCEIFCTAYAAWNDLILWGKQATEDNILHEILERWHDSKKRFPKDRWLKAIAWMKKEGFVPTGFGKPTKEAK